jgi:hypothetical protein
MILKIWLDLLKIGPLPGLKVKDEIEFYITNNHPKNRGQGVVVVVADDGLEWKHEDLRDNYR